MARRGKGKRVPRNPKIGSLSKRRKTARKVGAGYGAVGALAGRKFGARGMVVGAATNYAVGYAATRGVQRLARGKAGKKPLTAKQRAQRKQAAKAPRRKGRRR